MEEEGCCGGEEEEVDLSSNSTFHSMPDVDFEDFGCGAEEENVPNDFFYYDEHNETFSEAKIQNLKEQQFLEDEVLEDSRLYFQKMQAPATQEEEVKR